MVPTLRSTIARIESESESLSDWPRSLMNIKATGEVWEMRDVYGTRLAVIAAYTYPGVYLFDVDLSGLPVLTDGRVYDDVEQATEAWRKKLGDEAGDAEPKAVTDTERLETALKKRNPPLPPHRSFFDDSDPAEMAGSGRAGRPSEPNRRLRWWSGWSPRRRSNVGVCRSRCCSSTTTRW